MKITIEDIRYALTAAAVEKDKLTGQIATMAGKLRKMNLILARETRVRAEIDLFVNWEIPAMTSDAIEGAKRQLALELVEEIMERGLFVIEINERGACRRLTAEIRVLRPEKARELV